EGMAFLKCLRWTEAEDQFLARAFRDAGFVILGKTNTPELGILPTTEPAAYGPTHNPWDSGRSPGGSSGGSAAAVAAGIAAGAYVEEVGADPGRLRIGLMTAPPGEQFETHPECVAAAEVTARALERLGHSVEPTRPDAIDDPEYVETFLLRWTVGIAWNLKYW